MAMVVIGGHSRKVGKTSVTEGLIRQFRQCRWTAIKISSHWHADRALADDFLIYEELPGQGRNSDTSRYLEAGAAKALWAQTRPQGFPHLLSTLNPALNSSSFTIIESNAILRYVRPELFIMVLRYDVSEFKDSAREILARADAIVAIHSGISIPAWKDGVRAAMDGIPVFETPEPGLLPQGFPGFIKARLGLADL